MGEGQGEYASVQCVCPATPCRALLPARSFSVIGNAQGLCGHCSQLLICSYSKKLSSSVSGNMQSAGENDPPWADWDCVMALPYVMTAQ